MLVWMTHGEEPEVDQAHRAADGVAELPTRRALVTQSMIPPGLMSDQGIDPVETFARQDGDEDDPDPAVAEGVQAMMQASTTAQPMLYDGGASYLQVAEGQHWTSFDNGSPAEPRRAKDPLWLLDALTGAHDAETTGSDAVHDAPATRYRVHLDLITADAAIETGIRIPEGGPVAWWRRMPCYVWLDAQGRVPRMAFPHRAEVGDDTPLWTITELRAFGTPASIAAPDPGTIVEPRQVTTWPNQPPDQQPQ